MGNLELLIPLPSAPKFWDYRCAPLYLPYALLGYKLREFCKASGTPPAQITLPDMSESYPINLK